VPPGGACGALPVVGLPPASREGIFSSLLLGFAGAAPGAAVGLAIPVGGVGVLRGLGGALGWPLNLSLSLFFFFFFSCRSFGFSALGFLPFGLSSSCVIA
jgi:hypothetical protein